MSLLRYRPFTVSDAFGPGFDRLFEGWMDDVSDRTWLPRVDLFEAEGALVARFEVPGFDPEALEVTVEDGILTVSGTREYEAVEGESYHRRELAQGTFRRSLRITDAYDAENVQATYRNGILEIRLSKRPEVLPRKIEISTEG